MMYPPGFWDEPPLQWFDCEECGGDGYTVHRITVYEAGCGFPHDDTDERVCTRCLGKGGWLSEAEGDQS